MPQNFFCIFSFSPLSTACAWNAVFVPIFLSRYVFLFCLVLGAYQYQHRDTWSYVSGFEIKKSSIVGKEYYLN